jgi:hypothetical protein
MRSVFGLILDTVRSCQLTTTHFVEWLAAPVSASGARIPDEPPTNSGASRLALATQFDLAVMEAIRRAMQRV